MKHDKIILIGGYAHGQIIDANSYHMLYRQYNRSICVLSWKAFSLIHYYAGQPE